MLEAHRLGQQILVTVNAKLIDRGLMLKTGTVVGATSIAAPSLTKNDKVERDPEMHQTKKCTQWHFGMNAHIGVGSQSGLVPRSQPLRPTPTTSPKPKALNKTELSHALRDKLEKLKASIRAKVELPFRVINC